MRDQEESPLRLLHLTTEDAVDIQADARVEPGRRFVGHDERGRGGEGEAEADPRPLPAAQLRGEPRGDPILLDRTGEERRQARSHVLGLSARGANQIPGQEPGFAQQLLADRVEGVQVGIDSLEDHAELSAQDAIGTRETRLRAVRLRDEKRQELPRDRLQHRLPATNARAATSQAEHGME